MIHSQGSILIPGCQPLAGDFCCQETGYLTLCLYYFASPEEQLWRQSVFYTLSHLKNESDVSLEYTLVIARATCVCFHAWRMRLAACILGRDQWRHGRSRDETKYRGWLLSMRINLGVFSHVRKRIQRLMHKGWGYPRGAKWHRARSLDEKKRNWCFICHQLAELWTQCKLALTPLCWEE